MVENGGNRKVLHLIDVTFLGLVADEERSTSVTYALKDRSLGIQGLYLNPQCNFRGLLFIPLFCTWKVNKE